MVQMMNGTLKRNTPMMKKMEKTKMPKMMMTMILRMLTVPTKKGIINMTIMSLMPKISSFSPCLWMKTRARLERNINANLTTKFSRMMMTYLNISTIIIKKNSNHGSKINVSLFRLI